MKFEPTDIPGAYLVTLEPREDDRGFFARAWCRREAETAGLNGDMVQTNIGYSHRAGTLRGMHFQKAPHQEVKVVRCTRGSVLDVLVDLRQQSTTYLRWFGIELSRDNRRMLYVPEGCAHGYQTLTDDTELVYQTSSYYEPSAAHGVRYDDPAFGISWPLEVTIISDQDRSWPLLAPLVS